MDLKALYMLGNSEQLAPLTSLPPETVAIVKVLDVDEDLRLRLNAMGLEKGKSIVILRQAQLDGPLHIRLNTTELILRRSIAEKIRVSLT